MTVVLSAVVVFTCALASTAKTSCRGRCGEEYYRGYICNCDFECLVHDECCKDYEFLCTTKSSCQGRCGEPFKRGKQCNCDVNCLKYNQCCPDFKNYCDAEDITDDQYSPMITPESDLEDSLSYDMLDSPDLPDPSPETVMEDIEADLTKITSGYEAPSTDAQDEPQLEEIYTIFPQTEASPTEPPNDQPAQTETISSVAESTNTVSVKNADSSIMEGPSISTTLSASVTTVPAFSSSESPPTDTAVYQVLDQTAPSSVPSTGTPAVEDLLQQSQEPVDDDMQQESHTDKTPSLFGQTTASTKQDGPKDDSKDHAFDTLTDITSPSLDTGAVDRATESKDESKVQGSTPETWTTFRAMGEVLTAGPTSPAEPEPGEELAPKTTVHPRKLTAPTATTKPVSKPQEKPAPTKPTPAKQSKPQPKPTLSNPFNTGLNIDNPRDYQGDDANDTNLCSGRPASAVTTLKNGTMVAFRGHYFWMLDSNRVPGPARDITDVWGVPSPVDTIFTRCNCQGKTYIFKGSQYWRFDNDVVDPGYPKLIRTGFDGLQGQITAALSVPQYRRRRESVYFFKRGGLVQKYSYQFGTSPTCGRKVQHAHSTVRIQVARQAVSLLGPSINIRLSWKGFPSTVTSALSMPTSRRAEGYNYYVFSRSKYYNVKMDDERPVIASPPTTTQQKNSAKDFFNCPKEA